MDKLVQLLTDVGISDGVITKASSEIIITPISCPHVAPLLPSVVTSFEPLKYDVTVLTDQLFMRFEDLACFALNGRVKFSFTDMEWRTP